MAHGAQFIQRINLLREHLVQRNKSLLNLTKYKNTKRL